MFFLFGIFFPDAPEIITEESYLQKGSRVQLELLCIVHAFPRARVRWYKDGRRVHEEEEEEKEEEGEEVQYCWHNRCQNSIQS